MSVSVDLRSTQGTVPETSCDVAVVGAGPYGLSTAAHLLGKGLKVAVFGKPLQLWRDTMPEGMLLRSFWWASNLSDPQKQYSLAQYFRSSHQDAAYPLPIETFIEYGLWFQRHAVPNVDETYVAEIERHEDLFVLVLEDGRRIRTHAVVLAPGLHYYTYCPPEYAHLSPERVSHASQHRTLESFTKKRVAVIGGGQSALELAALLHEKGARVDVISRRKVQWLAEEKMGPRTLREQLRAPRAGIAPGWFNWTLENLPYTFQRLPRSLKDRLLRGRGRYGPAGSAWLKPRVLGAVTLREGRFVREASEGNGGVTLVLSNDEVVDVDHVILSTGYRADIRKLPMLSPTLLSAIQTYQGAPILTGNFESNVPGLYFVGFSSVLSCGPFYRFVVGTAATAHRVAGAVARQVTRVA